MLRSAAHETYHFVENYSAKDAADLRDYVIDALKVKGIDIDEALEKYAKQGYATKDEQISELVADSMFDVFSNEDFIKNLTAKNQTLAKRLANHIGEIVKQIRDAVKMLSVRYSNPEIKALMDDAEKLDTIRNMLLEGYQRASENFKASKDDVKTEKPKSVNSFASAAWKYGVVYQAEAMEQEGASREDIWKKLGVIRDAKGMWVYEIDDSEMKIYPNGDARLHNEDGYKRMNALFEKAFINGEQLTDAEQKEYSELNKKYNVQKKIAIDIGDYIVHDKLFDEYPEIAKATFGFDDLKDRGVRGYYDTGLNEIILDNSLKNQINSRQLGKTAIHEIQHAIQHFDGRAGGASSKFWQNKISNGESIGKHDRAIEKVHDARMKVWNAMSPELQGKVAAINRALIEGNHEKVSELETDLYNHSEEDYDLFWEHDEYFREEYRLRADNTDMTAQELYLNTAGEIEARETADRLKMTAEERAQKMPDLGWERAVFAEKGRKNESIEQTTDNRMVVVVKDDIVKNSTNNSDLIKKVKQALGRFPKVPIHNQEIIIGRKAKKETVYSKYTQNIRKTDVQKYNDKMNLLNHPYELIYATTNYINEPLNHPRKDNIVDFARGTVLMSIGGRNYSAKVIVGYTSSGVCELYDVINFDDSVSFQIRKTDNSQAVHPQEMEFDRYELSDDNMISQNDTSVNDNFMQSSSDDSTGQIFSRKQTDPIHAHYAEVMRENRNLKNIISALDEMQYSSARSNIHLDGRDIHNIAGRLLRNASSKYELSTFENELTAVYDYMANRNKKGRFLTAQHLNDNITSK